MVTMVLIRSLAAVATFVAAGGVAAQGLAVQGAKGTLAVEYRYEHSGQPKSGSWPAVMTP